MIFLGGIIGAQLAPNEKLSTLPYTLLIIGSAVFSVPAGNLMTRFGRKKAFLFSSVLTVFASLIACVSQLYLSFTLFCFASLLFGFNRSFLMQYRFAICDGIKTKNHSLLLSLLMVSNVFSGWLGTKIQNISIGKIGISQYSNSFLILSILLFLASIFFMFYKNINITHDGNKIKAEEKKTIKSDFIRIALLGGISYFIMSILMVSTPIQMKILTEYSLHEISIVMQWHFISMYLPSIFLKKLVSSLGEKKLIFIGAVFFLTSILISNISHGFYNILISLSLLGIGWSFSFLACTILLQKICEFHERIKYQSLNDLIVFSFNAIASLLSGLLIFQIGWKGISTLCFFLTIIMLIYSLSLNSFKILK